MKSIKIKIIFTIIIWGISFTLGADAQKEIPSEEEFFNIIHTEGVAKATEVFRNVRKNHPDTIIFREEALNRLGYAYLNSGKIEDAMGIFKLNIEAYPDAFNTYDSYAEVCMAHGNIELAIENYKKSVEINPDNLNGTRYIIVLENYDKHEYMIPMRDQVKLYTQVYIPKNTSRTYPILFLRTPYSVRNYGLTNYRNRLGPSDMFAEEGFIFVYQDVRGKFKSEGEFVVMRPYMPVKQGPRDTDESSDTYDTIEWLLKNIPHHNGRVGMWGGSYDGWQTVMGMIDAHPALKASCPRASPADMWIGDDFHHNGAFRLMYTFDWLVNDARPRTRPTTIRPPPFNYGTPDGYKFFMDLGPIFNINSKYLHNQIPTWDEYMEHGDYDEYWKKQSLLQYLDNITHPILNVAAWFDAEDFYGPLSIYSTIEKENTHNKSILVVGPWYHGGWGNSDGDQLGDIKFDQKTGVYFREKVEFPFFMYHLKGEGKLDLPEALVFETGSNQWRPYERWPPRGTTEKLMYFQTDGKLSFDPPLETSNQAFDDYTSDPEKPVPWSKNIQNRQGHLWMVGDQRFAARRPDVLVYQSDILTENITIAGPIIASLYVSTTGTDADWIVKLIDVYPSNAPNDMGDYQMLLAGEVLRSKYRNSLENPEPMAPNQVTKIEFDLRDKFHCFLKGHRIMVQVQSTWFPVIDRNPQKFVDIYKAKEGDFQKAAHRVYHSPEYSSCLKILVLK